jgi:hypothetical protein
VHTMSAQLLIALVLAFLGWLMVRLGVGAVLVGGNLLFDGNAWALLLLLPAAAGLAVGAFAVRSAVEALYGRGPAGRR